MPSSICFSLVYFINFRILRNLAVAGVYKQMLNNIKKKPEGVSLGLQVKLK